MTQEPAEWPAAWTAQIGQAVRHARTRAGLSAEGLSQRCENLGVKIPRNTIANLENGRKAAIPLHEVLALAAALDLAPLELMAPIGHAESVLLFPATEVDPYSMLEWIAGRALLRRDRAGGVRWDWEDDPDYPGHLGLWRAHDKLTSEWWRLHDLIDEIHLELANIDAGEETTDEWLGLAPTTRETWESRLTASHRRLQVIPATLSTVRRKMRAQGLHLPALDPSIEEAVAREQPEAP